MATESENEINNGEGLDDEGCEAEVMALVVIDEFPIEASHQRLTPLTNPHN